MDEQLMDPADPGCVCDANRSKRSLESRGMRRFVPLPDRKKRAV